MREPEVRANGVVGPGAPGREVGDPQRPTRTDPTGPDRDEVPEERARRAAEKPMHLAIFDDHLRSFPLTDGTLVVGRSKRNHLRLHDHLLSRKHCSLTLHNGRLTLVDLNSSNGTFVNGERVATRELAVDDLIELGKTIMVVFDGSSWRRGEGLLNLRNPMKAQELVHRLHDGSRVVRASQPPAAGGPRNGVRPRKGLDERERAFLRWLEGGESRLLPDLVTDYLTHKLVSLLVRNSLPIRSAFTTVLEEMMRPEFFQRFDDVAAMRRDIRALVHEELSDLRDDPPGVQLAGQDRGLLEPDPLEGGSPTSGVSRTPSSSPASPTATRNPEEDIA